MATIPSTVHGVYGVTSTLDGYTIESENITSSPIREQVPDQFNRVAAEIRYDNREELRLTVRGAAKPSDSAIEYASKKWIVDSVEFAGSYNGLQRYNITAHRYTECEAETALSTSASN